MDQMKEKTLQWIDDHEARIISFLQRLVSTPSVTHPPGGDEGPVQKIIAEKMESMGLTVDVFEPHTIPGIQNHPGWWPGLDYTGRPNVVGVWKGTGGGKILILNGHCDVVNEGDRALWDQPPFSGLVENGKLYGRGAVDMKGGIAAMIMAVEALRESGVTLPGDVILESAVNEELGGYNGTLACIVKGYEGDGAIVTEPTDLKVEPGNKGVQGYHISIPGHGAHTGFWWEGVSALDKAILIKNSIEDFAAQRYQETRHHPLYNDPLLFPIPAVTDCVYAFQAGDPQIMGVPDAASMDVMIDIMPGESLEEVTARFENHLKNTAAADPFLKDHPIRIEPIDMRPIYPTAIPLDHAMVESAKEAAGQILGRKPLVCGFEAACDAMMFNCYSSTPAMVFGPGKLQYAHRPNEFIEISQLMDATRILALTILDFCSQPKG